MIELILIYCVFNWFIAYRDRPMDKISTLVLMTEKVVPVLTGN